MSAANSGAKLVEIFVTTQAIGEQEEITPDKISLEEWPADKVPAGSTADLSALEGRFAKQAFYAGEPVLDGKLMNEKTDVVVPKGYRVVSMDTSRNSGIANLVSQGDRVDVDAYFTKSDLFPETKSVTILSGVRVFAIDGRTRPDEDAKKKTKSVRSISLLVRKADQAAWLTADKTGELSLSLGSPGGDYESPDAETVPSESGANFVKWLDDHRAEQRRLKREAAERKAAEAQASAAVVDDSASDDSKPKSKKGTFRTTKFVEGRMIVYEWTPGNPIPTIVADTGNDAAPGIIDDPAAGLDDIDVDSSEDDLDLSGENSPFFSTGE